MDPRTRLDRLAPGLLAALLVAQLASVLILGRFPHTDESFYKAAGREWARSGRFAAPELEGFTRTDPGPERVFFAYPPLYPWLFGVASRLCGFSWRTCVGFDALIHAALVLVTWRLARRLLPAAPERLAVAVAALVVPLGTAGRPDELGMTLALLGFIPLVGAAPRRSAWALSALALGLAAATSPGVAALLGAQALALLRGRDASVRRVVAWLVLAGVVLAAALAPVLLAAPHAWRQLLGQAVLAERVRAGFSWPDLGAWRASLPLVVCLGVLVAIGLIALFARALAARDWRRLWLAPSLGFAAVVLLLPGKHTYLWMIGPWLLIACAATLARVRAVSQRAAALAGAGVVALVAIASLPGLHRTLVLLSLPAEQSLDLAARRLVERIPPGSRVLVDEMWWALADTHDVRDAFWSRPADVERLEWVVLSGNGTGAPGRPRALPEGLAAHVAARFEVVHDDLNRGPATLLGLRISRSGYGFGTLVLRASRGSGSGQ